MGALDTLSAVIVGGIALGGLTLALIALALAFLALFLYWLAEVRRPLALDRLSQNPILRPIAAHWWESEAVFNPAALVDNGRVHLLYRAMGRDGISRIGYASSSDGVHFDERYDKPVFTPTRDFGIPKKKLTYGPLCYDTLTYPSGGGWGGSEDPRLIKIDDEVIMTFVAFDGWGFVRMALTRLGIGNFRNKEWFWRSPALLSPPGVINKNWVLFPEKIGGRYAVLHSLSPQICIDYFDSLDAFDGSTFIESRFSGEGRKGCWDERVRGAGAPPIRTPEGWLLFYHGFHPAQPQVGYKVGAMLLDLDDPTRVVARSEKPVLEPHTWYENDWKPGVAYASGAVVLGRDLFVYYGGGDKYVAAAKADLRDFVRRLRSHEDPRLEEVGR